MGDTVDMGGNNRETNSTATKFRLRSALLRTGRARIVLASILCIGLAAATGYAVHGANSSRSATSRTNSSTVQELEETKEGATSSVQQLDESEPKQDSSDNNGANSSRTQITVNGKTVTVPANGSYHQSTNDGDTQTNINVENNSQSSSTGSSSNSSSSDIRVDVRSGP